MNKVLASAALALLMCGHANAGFILDEGIMNIKGSG